MDRSHVRSRSLVGIWSSAHPCLAQRPSAPASLHFHGSGWVVHQADQADDYVFPKHIHKNELHW